MPRNRPSALYQLGLGLVTITMAILPCIYVALMAAACYGVYYFATHDFVAVWEWNIGHSKGALIVKVLCSVTPLLVGAIVAFFMVKPLFARRGARMQPLALDPAVEPRVRGLVEDICAAVGAPVPQRIELDCDLNASASFDRGLRGLFTSKLILTLGMPLIAGLNQRELAGVIAHEFGHFRQGAGMRLSYLLRTVNGWFARVVYERDAWDATIEGWSQDAQGWVSLMVLCAQLGVWVSRRVLWVLLITGHGISSFLLRQMEYDADRAGVYVGGTAVFETTERKLAALGMVYSEIHREMARVWRKQMQLPDNLPVLLEYRATRLPEAQRVKVEREYASAKTGFLDTHPCSADRVRHARALAEPGFDISDEPARDLFENFEMVSRLVTLAYYEDELNVPTSEDFLIPLEKVVLAKGEAAASEPRPAPVVAPVPMMKYDPSAFRGKEDPKS